MKKLLLYILLFTNAIAFAQPKESFNVQDKNGKKQGYWRKYYDEGKLRYEGNFKDNNAIGVFKYYYPTGQLKATNTYSENGKKAFSVIFYTTGKKQAEGNFINEKKDSVWLFYNQDEKLISAESYKLNKKTGPSYAYYSTGKVADETNWLNDEKVGAWKTYWDDGQLKSTAKLNKGDIEGRMIFYHANGMVDLMGDYRNGNRDGEWVTYHPDGKIKMKEIYKDGTLKETKLINGVFEEFYQDDVLKSKITYKDAKKDGDFIEYFDGAIKKMEQRKGEDGYPDETVEVITNHYPKIKGKYKNDKYDGEITLFKAGGKVDKIEVYENGVLKGKK